MAIHFYWIMVKCWSMNQSSIVCFISIFVISTLFVMLVIGPVKVIGPKVRWLIGALLTGVVRLFGFPCL